MYPASRLRLLPRAMLGPARAFMKMRICRNVNTIMMVKSTTEIAAARPIFM